MADRRWGEHVIDLYMGNRDGPRRSNVTMFIRALIAPAYRDAGASHIWWRLLDQAKVCLSPGVGFDEYRGGHCCFARIENEVRIKRGSRNQDHASGRLTGAQ